MALKRLFGLFQSKIYLTEEIPDSYGTLTFVSVMTTGVKDRDDWLKNLPWNMDNETVVGFFTQCSGRKKKIST